MYLDLNLGNLFSFGILIIATNGTLATIKIKNVSDTICM